MSNKSILFSAEYTNLSELADNEKQYSEPITCGDKIFHFYCVPNEADDKLKIFVRCNMPCNFASIIITAQSEEDGEIVVFRVLDSTFDGAIGCVFKAATWANLKNYTSKFTKSGKLIFMIHVVMQH